MRFDVFSLFPQIFAPYFEVSILQRALERGLVAKWRAEQSDSGEPRDQTA